MLKQLSQLGEKLTDELQKSLGEASQGQDQQDSNASAQTDTNSNAQLHTTATSDIDAKLRRLQKFESKYPLLLQAYKTLKQQQAKLVTVITENTTLGTNVTKDGKDTGIIDADKLEEYLKQNEEKLASLNSEIQRLNMEIAEKDQTKIVELQQQQQQQQLSAAGTGAQMDTSKGGGNDSGGDDDDSNDEIENLRDMLRDVGNELVTAKDRIKELESAKTADTDNLKVTLQQRDKTISYLEAQVKQYSQTQQSDQSSLESAKSENSLLRKRMDAMQENIKQLTTRCETYLRENGKLSERLETIKRDYEKVEENDKTSKSEIDSMKRQYDEMNLKLKEANTRILSLEDELSDYTTTIRERSGELESLRNILTNLRNEDATNQRNFETKLALVAEEKSKLENQLALQSSRSTIELQNWKTQNAELKMQLEGIRMRETKLLEELKTMKEEEEKSEAMKHNNSRGSDHSNSNDSNNDSKNNPSNCEEMDKVQKNLKELLARSDKRRRELESTNDELMSLNNELNKKLDRLTKNYRSLSSKLNSMKNDAARGDNSVSTYNKSDSHTNGHNDNNNSNSRSSGGGDNFVARTDSSVNPNVARTGNTGGDKIGAEDEEKIAYVRNVLLGFLEHKEQRRHLLPVVSTLLQLDSDDEQRFLAALDIKG